MTFRRALAAMSLALAPCIALASNFGVTPLRLDIGPKAKSGSFTVSNQDKAPITFQVSVKKWTQEPGGKDVYTDSKELVVFPTQLEIKPGQKKIVRVGFEGTPPKHESAYRVFIEELPAPVKVSEHGGEVRVLGRFGLAVLVRDKSSVPHLAIDELSVKGGKVTVKVSNSGDSAARVQRLSLGKSKELLPGFAGNWVLAGSWREFTGMLEGADCKPGTHAVFEVESFLGVKASKEVTLPADACNA